MKRCSRLVSIVYAVMVLAAARLAPAQPLPSKPQPPSTAENTPANPVIADGPVTIDPATLMPAPLAVRVSVDFQGESLLEVAEWLTEKQGVTTLIDTPALTDLGLTYGEPVYDQLNNAPLYFLLERLKMLELGWYYEDRILTITTQEEAENRLVTAPYNLGDLLDKGYDREALLESIVSTIAASTWADGGGEAEVRWIGDVLFVSQNQQVHRELRGLFTALREFGKQTFVFEPPRHQALRDKLAAPMTIRLDQTPLVVAVEKIAEAAGVDLRIDLPAIDGLGIRQREPVSVNLADRPLELVLRAAFGGLELTPVARDGVLWLTSEEQAESLFVTAVYDVRDLCRDDGEQDALVDALISQVAADTWAENGGGEAEVRFARTGVMVVTQTQRYQRELLTLLDRYREALKQSKRRVEPEADPNEVLTRYYRLQSGMAESLADVLPTLVPGDWDGDPTGKIVIVASKDDVWHKQTGPSRVTPHTVLVIEQTRSVHDKIAEVIRRVQSGDALPSQGQGGGGFGGGGGGFGGGFFNVLGDKPGG